MPRNHFESCFREDNRAGKLDRLEIMLEDAFYQVKPLGPKTGTEASEIRQGGRLLRSGSIWPRPEGKRKQKKNKEPNPSKSKSQTSDEIRWDASHDTTLCTSGTYMYDNISADAAGKQLRSHWSSLWSTWFLSVPRFFRGFLGLPVPKIGADVKPFNSSTGWWMLVVQHSWLSIIRLWTHNDSFKRVGDNLRCVTIPDVKSRRSVQRGRWGEGHASNWEILLVATV